MREIIPVGTKVRFRCDRREGTGTVIGHRARTYYLEVSPETVRKYDGDEWHPTGCGEATYGWDIYTNKPDTYIKQIIPLRELLK